MMNISVSLPYILLPLTCLSFDEVLKRPFIVKNYVLRAIVDNVAHGLVAFLSWLAVLGTNNVKKNNFLEVILCGIIACAIDLDHFIAAKSFRLKAALSLDQRPPLHSTSILIPIVLCGAILSRLYYPSFWTIHVPLLLAVSFISHHVRDGHRRGLWFWPVGSTPPIPYWLYLLLITVLPALITLIIKVVKNKSSIINIEIL